MRLEPATLGVDDLGAVARILILAENSPIWKAPRGESDSEKLFRDESYAAIERVRDILRPYGLTLSGALVDRR